ncbi:MAG TPA: Fe-S cluster assembly protein SufD [Flavobacteriales bacterium]|nr:Fe-S cluster assembly protein SufD [Flavobacteriales bacterium]
MSEMSDEKESLIPAQDQFISSLKDENLMFQDRLNSYEAWKSCPAPTRKDEFWKYTQVGPLLKKTYRIANATSIAARPIEKSQKAINLVFVNGIFSASDSDSIDRYGLAVSDLRSAIALEKLELAHLQMLEDKSDYFSLLNRSFYQNGPFISIGKNCTLEKPIHIVHVLTESDRLINIKGLVVVGEGASVRISETWESGDSRDNLLNTTTALSLKANASVELIKIQSIGENNNLVSQEFATVQKDAKLSINTISTEGNLIRNNIHVSLMGEGGECYLNGLFLGAGNQHIDNHTIVNHDVPNCYSNELYKGILSEKAKGVFNGKVIVKKDAQKTNAFQYNGNLLLGDEAQIYSKPELEIYADDVKCSHGSTTGQLNKEALFYLESRGISKEGAKHLLVYAFAQEVLEKISLPELRDKIDAHLAKRFQVLQDA